MSIAGTRLVPTLAGDPRHYASDSRAPSDARLHVRAQLGVWGLSLLADDVETVTSELVTNAVLHGGGDEVALRLELAGQALTVKVWDASPHMAHDAGAGIWDESGRGLVIVEALASDHGWYPADGGGKVTWAEFAITKDPA